MKYRDNRWLLVSALALLLCGCGYLQPRPKATVVPESSVDVTKKSSSSDDGAMSHATDDASQETLHSDSSMVVSDNSTDMSDDGATSNATDDTKEDTLLGDNIIPEFGDSFLPKPYMLKLNVFGLSYHPDRTGTRVSSLDNELNIGLGLAYRLHKDTRSFTDLEVGFFRDSGYNWAKYLGVGYYFKLGKNWRIGADLLAMQSGTYNRGRPFIAPFPRLTYDFGLVKLNATYIARVPPLNKFSAFAIYFTVPLTRGVKHIKGRHTLPE